MFSRQAIETTSEQLNTKQMEWNSSVLRKKQLRTTDYGESPASYFKETCNPCMYDTSKKKRCLDLSVLHLKYVVLFCTIVIFFRVISFQHKFINMFMHTWGYLENEGTPKKRNHSHPPKINMSPEQKGKISFQAAFLSRDRKGTPPPMPHFPPRNSLPSYTSRWL